MVKRQLKQKQKQSQSVNIYLGSKSKAKGKGKRRPKKSKGESKPFIAPYNPSPIINYPPNFPYNLPSAFGLPVNQINPLLPPPAPRYAAFPESQTAEIVNLNPAQPVPFKFEPAVEKLKAPPKEPKLVAPEVKAEEEVVLPTDAEALAAELASAEAAAIEGEAAATAEEEASIRSALTGPSVGPPTYESGNPPSAPPSPAFADFGRNLLAQPFNVPTFAESSPFFPVEASITAEPKGPAKKEKGKKTSSSSAGSGFGVAGSINTYFPSITPANPLSVVTGLPVNFPPPLFTIPITEKQPRTFTLGQSSNPYSFIGTTAPHEKAKGEYLQRQRGTGLTPAEESLLLSP